MNILHVAYLDNNKSNGVSVIVPDHLKNQSIFSSSTIYFMNLNEEINNKIIEVKKQSNLQEVKYSKREFISQLCSRKIELVIFHEVYRPKYIEISRELKKNKIKYIIIPHGCLTFNAQKRRWYKKKIGNYIFGSFLKNAKAIQYLTVSEKEASKIGTNKNKNSMICGNGMYVDNIYNSHIKKERFEITFIGRFDPHHKGIDLLIEAANHIKDSMREKKIVISLYGPDDHGGKFQMDALVKKYDIEDIILIKDALYGIEKQNVLAQTDVFILTSRFEGQPLVLLEAMAKGIPVIVTPGTNLANKVTEYNCGYVAEATFESIGEKILQAFNEKNDLKFLSNNCINYIEQEIEWKKTVEKTMEIYKK